jgi:hypothetical protein
MVMRLSAEALIISQSYTIRNIINLTLPPDRSDNQEN